MKVKIVYFTILADIVGREEEHLELNVDQDNITIKELFDYIANLHPELKTVIDEVIAVRGDELLSLKERIRDGDTIVLLPPGSGG